MQTAGAVAFTFYANCHGVRTDGRYTAFTMISMAAGVSVAFPALWLASYAWNTRATGGPLKPQHGRSWTVRPAAVPAFRAMTVKDIPCPEARRLASHLRHIASATGITMMHAPPATAFAGHVAAIDNVWGSMP